MIFIGEGGILIDKKFTNMFILVFLFSSLLFFIFILIILFYFISLFYVGLTTL